MKVEVQDHTKEILAALDHKIPIILEALGIEAEGNAVSEINKLVYDTPQSPTYIRTGRLKGSITHRHDAESAYIGTDVKYAPYVEFGTTKMDPRPFLRNAITNYADDYKRIIEESLKS
jgi:HK97 gp10 family phage protein